MRFEQAEGVALGGVLAPFGPGVTRGDLRIHARQGQRAVLTQVKPGLYVIAIVPEASIAGPELGIFPAISKVLQQVADATEEAVDKAKAKHAAKRAENGGSAKAAIAGCGSGCDCAPCRAALAGTWADGL